ncbi:MAG: hypothetical protein AAGA67_06555, partial [Cyanobacteria bacterium P01_F01_bin.153]
AVAGAASWRECSRRDRDQRPQGAELMTRLSDSLVSSWLTPQNFLVPAGLLAGWDLSFGLVFWAAFALEFEPKLKVVSH